MSIRMSGEIEVLVDKLYPFERHTYVSSKEELPGKVSELVGAVIKDAVGTLEDATFSVKTYSDEHGFRLVHGRVSMADNDSHKLTTVSFGSTGGGSDRVYWGTAFTDEPMYNDDEQLAKVLSGTYGDINVNIRIEENND